jgi:hypothetical protein
VLLDWNAFTGGADASVTDDGPVAPRPDARASKGDGSVPGTDSGSGNVREAEASEGGVDEAGALDADAGGLPHYNCNLSPDTCQGCCDPENEPDGSHICGGGTSTQACGFSGVKCAVCGSGQACIDGGCVLAPADAAIAPGSPCSSSTDPSGCPTIRCFSSPIGPAKACCLPLPPGQCGCVVPFVPGPINCF